MNFVSSSSKFFHRWLFSTNQKKIGSLYFFAFFVGLFVLFSLFWYLVNDSLILTFAYAMGKTDPSVGTFTIMSLQQVPCESISEFSSSMHSLISEPTLAKSGNCHQRFIQVNPSVINMEGMSMVQKLTIQAMPTKCFLALGELTK